VDIGAENHVPAAATVAAIRAATRHEFFAAETDAAPPAITRLGKNFYAIDKHTGGYFGRRSAKVPTPRPLVIPRQM
jgi:hypothetical protein